MNNKKAEMGIGTLIIFIAMILVAAIAAGVLLQTASSLQNKALTTGERSKVQVSTGLNTVLIWGQDGQDRDLEVFCQNMKLQPGSDAIKFADTLLEIHTKNVSSSKVYGKELANVSNETWLTTGVDMDGDGTNEKIILWAPDVTANCSNTNFSTMNGSTINGQTTANCEDGWSSTNYTKLVLNMSGSGTPVYNVIELSTSGNNVNLSAATSTSKVEVLLFDTYVNDSSNVYTGSVAVIGKTGTANNLDDSVYVFVGDATVGADGAYAVEYLVQGSLYRGGYLNRGDVVRVCYAAPREVDEDENLIINIVPKTGSTLRFHTTVPDVITHERVYIYP